MTANRLRQGDVFQCMAANIFSLEVQSLEADGSNVVIKGKRPRVAEFYRLSLPGHFKVRVKR